LTVTTFFLGALAASASLYTGNYLTNRLKFTACSALLMATIEAEALKLGFMIEINSNLAANGTMPMWCLCWEKMRVSHSFGFFIPTAFLGKSSDNLFLKCQASTEKVFTIRNRLYE
jgi:hypothetical protein